MGDDEPMTTPAKASPETVQHQQPEQEEQQPLEAPKEPAAAASSSRAEDAPDAAVVNQAALSQLLDEGRSSPPAAAQAASEPEASSAPGASSVLPQRVASLVVRPVAQRPAGGSATAAAPPAVEAAGDPPLTPSGSLAEPGWTPHKSAWSPYRPSLSGSLPQPGSSQAATLGQLAPAASLSEPQEAFGAASPASALLLPPPPPPRPQPPVSLPVQNSLDILHDAAVSAATEGFLLQEATTAAVSGEETPGSSSGPDAGIDQGHKFLADAGAAGMSEQQRPVADDRQIPTDAMEALQAAASALFRRFAEMPGASQAQPTASEAVPLGFGSRLPSMAGSSAAAAGTFLEAARAAAAASAASTASQPASTSTWHQETAASTSQAATEQQQAPPASKAEVTSSGQKGWAEAAAALLGPVAPRLMPLTSAFSEALATRGGQLQSLAMPAISGPAASAPPAPRQGSGPQDWATARLGSASSESPFSLPLTAWRLGSGPEGMKLTASLPVSMGLDGQGFFKAPGPVAVHAGTHNLPSLTMPGTPSISNMPSRSSLSPPLSPQHGQEGLSILGRQLEMCLARQVHLQNVKRNGPTTAFLVEDPASGVPVINPRLTGFGPIPWPHPSQHSLDSQVSRTQLAQSALDRAEFFKVPGNLAQFLKQASLDTAMAALQQREATPPTPHARQLASGAGAVWPYGIGGPSVGVPSAGARPGGAGVPSVAQLDSPSQRLPTLNLQSPHFRSHLGSLGGLGGELPGQRFQASQQVFGDFGGGGGGGGGGAASPQLHQTEAALADSLYASVARQLQSGAGPAAFPQQQAPHYSPHAAEEAAAAGGGFYRLDSGAALGMHGGGNPYGDVQQQVHMLELLGLLRAGLAGQGAAGEAPVSGSKRKRRGESPGGGRGRARDDGGASDAGAPQPPPKRSANNKCEECGTTETPTWRRWGPTLLCNACGLRRKKSPKSAAARQQPPSLAAPAGGYGGQPAWAASAAQPGSTAAGQLGDLSGQAPQHPR